MVDASQNQDFKGYRTEHAKCKTVSDKLAFQLEVAEGHAREHGLKRLADEISDTLQAYRKGIL